MYIKIDGCISLIGFMGVGKSTIGQTLVEKINFKLVETDKYIEDIINQPIIEYIKQNESKFRKLEHQFCQSLSECKDLVISCGGGIILNPENVRILREKTVVILLEANLDLIKSRILKDGIEKRPLIQHENPMDSIEKIYFERKEIYDNAHHIKINVDDKSPNQICDEIINNLPEKMKIK